MGLGKKKAIILIVFSLIVIVSLSSLAAGFFQKREDIESVEFTCNAGSEYQFVFTVNVDLNDGLDENEASVVAGSLYEHEMEQKNYEVKTVESNGDDMWTVYLLWGSVSPSGERENHSHYYNVHINAADRTVTYDRCY